MSDKKFQNKYRIPSARVAWHDYSGGVYFVTICTANREHYFGEITNGEIQLSGIGKFTDECVRKIENLHPDISVPLYVIMPNHIHLIVFVDTPVETPYYDVSTETETPQCDVFTETDTETETPQCDVSTMIGMDNRKNEKMQSIANRCGRLSHVISRFKTVVTRYANQNNIPFKWQARFHDRIVRDQNELNRIAQYIENNPYNWITDEYY